jgi:hypothetical protein
MIQASLFIGIGLLVGFLGGTLFRKKGSDENEVALYQENSALSQKADRLENTARQLERRCISLENMYEEKHAAYDVLKEEFDTKINDYIRKRNGLKLIMEEKRVNRYINKKEMESIFKLLN